MAKLTGYGEGGKLPGLKATVAVESSFRWRLDALKEHLDAVLATKSYLGQLKVKDISSSECSSSSYYEISWTFHLGHTRMPGENEARLQRQTEPILAVFDEMEKQVREAKVLKEPLSWLWEPSQYEKQQEQELVEACCGGLPDEQEEKGLLEVCCSRPPSMPLEELKQDIACMMAIGAGGG